MTQKLITRNSMQAVLESELERLKRILQLGYELKVIWVPDINSKLSGEVKGDVIYIYDEDEEKAFKTLKHEMIDYAVSQTIQPYKEVTNRLISMINERAYQQKEKLVNRISKLL